MGQQFFPFGLMASKPIVACVLMQATIVSVVGIMVAGRLKAVHRHAVLTSAMLLLLACPLLVSVFHLSGIRLPISVTGLPDVAISTETLASQAESSSTFQPQELDGLPIDTSVSQPPSFSPDQIPRAELAESQRYELPAPVEAVTSTQRQPWITRLPELGWFGWATLVWLFGVVFGVVRLSFGAISLRRLLSTAQEISVPAQLEDSVQSDSFRTQSFRLFESPSVSVPIVAGLRRPMIVLPVGMQQQLTRQELAAVVAHEHAHADRGDCFVGLLQRLTGILYWFHPLVHWMNRRLAVAREEICDNYALTVTDAATYARVLLKLGESQRPQIGMTMPLVSTQWKLEDRIRGLLDAKRDRSTRAKAAGWVPAVAAVSFALFASSAQLVATPTEGQPQTSSGSSLNEIHRDLYGDPIPYEAEVRLGASRLRPIGDNWHRKITFTNDSRIVTYTTDGHVDWWDPTTGKRLHSRKMDFNSRAFAVSPDRSTFAVSYFKWEPDSPVTENGIAIMSLDTGEPIKSIPLETRHVDGSRLIYTPDGKNLLFFDEQATVRVIEIALGEELLSYKMPLDRRRMDAAALSPDGKQIAVAGNRKLWLWNWTEGSDPFEVKGLGDLRLSTLQYSPDGNSLLLCHDHGSVGLEVVDLKSRKVVRKFRDPKLPSMRFDNVSFANDGKLLIVPNEVTLRDQKEENGICIWNFATGELIDRLVSEKSPPGMIALSPDEKILATASDGEVAVWDMTSRRRMAGEFVAHTAHITGVRFAPNTNLIVTSSDDYSVRVWDAENGKQLRESKHDHWVRGMAVSPDGKWIASSALGDTLRLLDAKTMKTVYELPGNGKTGGKRTVAFSPDCKRFASFGDETYLRVWDVTTGKALLEEEIKPGGESLLPKGNGEDDFMRMEMMRACGFSADASRLFVISRGQPHIFDATTGKEIAKIESAKPVEAATFGPNNEYMLIQRPYVDATRTPLDDGRVRHSAPNKFEAALVNVETGETKWTFKMDGRSGPARIAPNGKIAVVSMRAQKSDQDTVYILDATNGEPLSEFIVGKLAWDSSGNNVGISGDGRLALPMRDNSVFIWDLKKQGAWK